MNKAIGISVKALYDTYGEKLTYSRIKRTIDENDIYYDLYNDKNILAIMDGETAIGEIAIITNKDIDSITLVSTADGNNSFRLSREEYGIAVFEEV